MSDLAAVTLREFKRHPAYMVERLFGVKPDPWQVEALEAFPHVDRLAFKACKGPGKTACESWLMWNFWLTRPKSKINATSITGDNLAINLWPELAKWRDKSSLLSELSEWTATSVKHRQFPGLWRMDARTWPKKANKQDQQDALAGLHADYAMWVLDESGSIPEGVLVSAEAVLASGIECKVVQAGNPTSLTGALYRACVRDRKLWKVVTITGDPARKDRSTRISIKWAQQQIDSYGRDNPWVMVNVLGEFPPSSINTLLGIEEVEAAIRRVIRPETYEWAQKRLGVDVARFGDDRTVIFPRQGRYAFRPAELRNARSTEIAARIMRALTKFPAELTIIDNTGGWGQGASDQLITANVPGVIPIIYSDKATNRKYKNVRTAMWMDMAEWVKSGGKLPDIPQLREELTEPTYTYIDGQIQLEPKDQIKDRLGFSPDYGDALANTFYLADMPAGAGEGGSTGRGRNSRAKTHDD